MTEKRIELEFLADVQALKAKAKTLFVKEKEVQGLRIEGIIIQLERFLTGLVGQNLEAPTRVYDTPLFPNARSIEATNVEILGPESFDVQDLQKNIERLNETILERENKDVLESSNALWILGLARTVKLQGIDKDTPVTVELIQQIKDKIIKDRSEQEQLKRDEQYLVDQEQKNTEAPKRGRKKSEK